MFSIIFAIKFLSQFQISISPWILIQISWFFIPWILIGVIFLNILNCIISKLNSSSDLIEFQRYLENFPNSPLIQPLFTIIPLNLWFNLKIGKFGLYFDRTSCVFNDRTSSFRQWFWSGLRQTKQFLYPGLVSYNSSSFLFFYKQA